MSSLFPPSCQSLLAGIIILFSRDSSSSSTSEGTPKTSSVPIVHEAATGRFATLGFLALCELAAPYRRLLLVDSRGPLETVNSTRTTLAATAWESLTCRSNRDNLARVVAYVPSRCAGACLPALRMRTLVEDPLASMTIPPSDIALLLLPPSQVRFFLRRHGPSIRRFAIFMSSGFEDVWDNVSWSVEPGSWPAGIRVLRRRPLSVYPYMRQREGTHDKRIAFVSIIGDGLDFQANLALSPIYQSRERSNHVWVLVKGIQKRPMASFLAELRTKLEREHPSIELMLLVHPDLFLPASFEQELFARLQYLNRFDSRWAFAGFFGVPLDFDGEPSHWKRPRLEGRGLDVFGRYVMGESNITPAQCIDEVALLWRTGGNSLPSPDFDPHLPSTPRIWVGGTDSILDGLAEGRRSYVLGVDVHHAPNNRDGSSAFSRHIVDSHVNKYSDPKYIRKHVEAMEYMSTKHLISGRVLIQRVHSQCFEFGMYSWRFLVGDLKGPFPASRAAVLRESVA